MTSQFDLFAPPSGPQDPTRKRQPAAARPSQLTDDEDSWVRKLEETGRYRLLRKLDPRSVVDRSESSFARLGVLVDTETTGLDHARDEVIELGMVAFTYDDEGRIGHVVDVFTALRQPYAPIPAAITRLTGITDEMVAGKTISVEAVEAFIAPADLVIAHNAKFDRPFCERLASGFSPKAWACSASEVAWADRGFEGVKLAYLIGQSGYFHNGHRAVDDCHALLEVLAQPWPGDSSTPFADLLRNSERAKIRIWATNSPFDTKDKLKSRGYRWSDGSDGKPKAWWTDVAEEESDDELRYLRSDIYQWPDVEPPTRRLTAFERFKTQG
jgi:DNA polymerase III subunit epsilon